MKSLLQNVDLYQYQINRIAKNFKLMLRIKEQYNEHLWQIKPKGVVNMIKVYGLARSVVKKIKVPILYMKISVLKLGVRNGKFNVPLSWDMTVWDEI